MVFSSNGKMVMLSIFSFSTVHLFTVSHAHLVACPNGARLFRSAGICLLPEVPVADSLLRLRKAFRFCSKPGMVLPSNVDVRKWHHADGSSPLHVPSYALFYIFLGLFRWLFDGQSFREDRSKECTGGGELQTIPSLASKLSSLTSQPSTNGGFPVRNAWQCIVAAIVGGYGHDAAPARILPIRNR